MKPTLTNKTFRPRKVRTSGNAPAEVFHISLRRTPSLGFSLPKQTNNMKTYNKEFAENWINKYNNSEAKAEGYEFFDFMMDHMMSDGCENDEAAEAEALCEEVGNLNDFIAYCEEISGMKL